MSQVKPGGIELVNYKIINNVLLSKIDLSYYGEGKETF